MDSMAQIDKELSKPFWIIRLELIFTSKIVVAQVIASQNIQKSTSRLYVGMISTPFRLKKNRPDCQNHQSCPKTWKLNWNRPKYFPKIVKIAWRLRNRTVKQNQEQKWGEAAGLLTQSWPSPEMIPSPKIHRRYPPLTIPQIGGPRGPPNPSACPDGFAPRTIRPNCVEHATCKTWYMTLSLSTLFSPQNSIHFQRFQIWK